MGGLNTSDVNNDDAHPDLGEKGWLWLRALRPVPELWLDIKYTARLCWVIVRCVVCLNLVDADALE